MLAASIGPAALCRFIPSSGLARRSVVISGFELKHDGFRAFARNDRTASSFASPGSSIRGGFVDFHSMSRQAFRQCERR